MMKRRLTALILLIVLAGLSGCQGSIDDVVGGINQRATQIAGGTISSEATPGESETSPPTEEPTPTPVVPSGFHDLTGDTSALLVQAWGQTAGLPTGSEFTIIADQYQVGTYLIQVLQSDRRSQSAVRGGSVALDLGQIRLDLALEDPQGKFGAGSISFQPTITANGKILLNPLGADFGSLRMGADFTTSLGDAVLTVLTGARSNELSSVNVTVIDLSGGIMKVAGTVR